MAKAKAKAVKPGGGGRKRAYWRLSFSLLDSRMGPIYKRFSSIQDKLRKSGIRLTYQVYLCGAALTSMIVTVATLIGSAVVAALLGFPIVSVALITIGVGIGGGAFSFILHLFYPRLKLGGRKRRIDEELAFVAGRMAVLSASGMTPESVIKEIAQDSTNDLLTQEFRRIVRDMSLLGMDLTQALQEARRRSPSDDLATFFDGMISTSASGADIQQYLVKQARSLMNDKRLKTKQFSETLGVIAEMYTTVLVVMPLILIILFAVMGVIAGSLGGISITLLIELVVYVMVPIGGIMIMVLADGIMPRR